MTVVHALRSGRWRQVDGGALAVAATFAVALDVATTAHMTLVDPGEHTNAMLAALAAHSPALAVAGITLSGAVAAGAAWLSLDWLSRFAGVYAVVSFGVTGVDGLYGILAGVDGGMLVDPWSGLYIHYGAPLLAVALTGAWLARRPDPVDWREFWAVAVGLVAVAGLAPAVV